MIHCRGLSRTFATRTGPVEAVRGVDLDVERGEAVGFLGPDGAGKTTTQRMLTTLLSPTAGTATVAGHDLLTEPVEPPGVVLSTDRRQPNRWPDRRGAGRLPAWTPPR